MKRLTILFLAVVLAAVGAFSLVGCKKASYNIAYELNGGVNDSANPTSYEEGSEFALKTPTFEGFEFLGWSLSPNSTDYVVGITKNDTGDKTFYANWRAVKYTVTLVLKYNDGTQFTVDGKTENIVKEVAYGTSLVEVVPVSSDAAFTFDCWAYIVNGVEKTIGGQVAFSKDTIDGAAGTTLELFAKAKAVQAQPENPPATNPEAPQEYTITFEKNGGEWNTGYTAPTKYTAGQEVTLPQVINKLGYNFAGWTVEGSSDIVTKISTTDTGNKTFYAKWVENTSFYTINYVIDGAVKVTLKDGISGFGVEATLADVKNGLKGAECVDDNYYFTGWYFEKGGVKVMVNDIQNISELKEVADQNKIITLMPQRAIAWAGPY